MNPASIPTETLSREEILGVLQETVRNRRSVLAKHVKHKMISQREMNHTINCLEEAIRIVTDS